MEITKICNKCKQELPLTKEFWYISIPKDRSKKTRYQCKNCKNASNNIYNNKNKEKQLQRQREDYEKNPEKYQNKRDNNKEYQKKYNQQWRAKNPEKIKKNNREWIENNREANKLRCRRWYENHIDYIKQYKLTHKDLLVGERFYKRYQEDLLFRIKVQLRNRLRSAIKGGYKTGSAVGDLGCSVEDFKQYIERQFADGMSWDNWGVFGWHLDHIRPLDSFDLSIREEFLQACNYTNLRPIWSKENLTKGNKDIGPTDSLASIINDIRIRAYPSMHGYDIDGIFVSEISLKAESSYVIPTLKANLANKRSMTFFACEIKQKRNIIISVIDHILGKSKTIGARDCDIRKMSGVDANFFFTENHLMGHHPSSTAHGLFHGDECLAAMAVRQTGSVLEISRFSNKAGYSVQGGFSKLLNYLEKNRKPSIIQSFCDLRYATGGSYTRNGFDLVGITQGWVWSDGENIYNRLFCRANMDDRRLSEAEHAKEMGLFKIYDAGQAKYIKTL